MKTTGIPSRLPAFGRMRGCQHAVGDGDGLYPGLAVQVAYLWFVRLATGSWSVCTKPTNTKEFCTLCGFNGEIRLASWVDISRQALRGAF